MIKLQQIRQGQIILLM